MVSIIKFFKAEDIIREKDEDKVIVRCPSCGSDSSNYGGMILNLDSQTAYCFLSRTWFNKKELYALCKGIISCREGRAKE